MSSARYASTSGSFHHQVIPSIKAVAIYGLFLLSCSNPNPENNNPFFPFSVGFVDAQLKSFKYVRGPTAEEVAAAAAAAAAPDRDDDEHPKKKAPIIIPQASMTVPMHYDSGSHHIYIYVGSPKPQRQTLILDTGSRYMAFPCEPCPDCGHHASPTYFNDTESTTHRDNFHPNCIFAKKRKADAKDDSCMFDQTYLEGSSWRAKEVEDMIFLATADQEESVEEFMPHLAIPFVFGCQYSVTGYFVNQVRRLHKIVVVAKFCSKDVSYSNSWLVFVKVLSNAHTPTPFSTAPSP